MFFIHAEALSIFPHSPSGQQNTMDLVKVPPSTLFSNQPKACYGGAQDNFPL